MLPVSGRFLDTDGGEEADPALPVENAGNEGLARPQEVSDPRLVQSGVTDPPAETPQSTPSAPYDHYSGISMTVTQVKDFCGTHATVKPTPEDARASKRYVFLVEELIREYAAASGKDSQRSREWGALSHVAETLGVSQPTLSKVLSGSRKAGSAAVRQAIKRLRIRDEYFYGPREPASYREFMTRGKEPLFSAWRKFLEQPESGQTMTPAEREVVAMAVVPDGREPTVAFYAAHLFALRNLLTRSEMNRAIEKSNEVQKVADSRRKTTTGHDGEP